MIVAEVCERDLCDGKQKAHLAFTTQREQHAGQWRGFLLSIPSTTPPTEGRNCMYYMGLEWYV